MANWKRMAIFYIARYFTLYPIRRCCQYLNVYMVYEKIIMEINMLPEKLAEVMKKDGVVAIATLGELLSNLVFEKNLSSDVPVDFALS